MEVRIFNTRNILLLALLIGQLSSVRGATALGDFSNKNYPGKCYLGEGKILSPGMHDYPPCAQFDCSSSGWAQIHMCSTEIPDDDCYDAGFISPEAEYPKCCRKNFICDYES